MPFIGRYTRYPIYPELGADPTKLTNIIGLSFEEETFLPGAILNYQVKTADSEIRLFDMDIEILDGELDFTIIEGATCVDGVTQVFTGSSDRNSLFVSTVYASSDPTAIVGGFTLDSLEHFGLPTPILGFGNVPPLLLNYVTLKYNTNYIFRFENVGTATIIDHRFLLLWAE